MTETDPHLNLPAFAYLHVRTSYGPGGGPGSAAEYIAAARGSAVLACTDYGTVAAWPAWAQAAAQAGLRPLYGLVFEAGLALRAEPGIGWPLLALAATGEGLRNLVRLHNRLERQDGRCLLPAAHLPAFAPGLWLVLLPAGDTAPVPLVAQPRRDALAAVVSLGDSLPRPEALLCGLPPATAEQGYFADLAAAAGLRSVALPTVRYPTPDHALAHAVLRASRDPRAAFPVDGAMLRDCSHTIEAPDLAAGRFAAHPDAVALALAVAESCQASLADLGRGRELEDLACAALESAVDEALAAAGRDRDAAIGAELVALRRLRQCGGLLAARRVAAAGRALELPLGTPGGVAAEGQVAALLGLCPANPFGAPAGWLRDEPSPAQTPRVTVPARRRTALMAYLRDHPPAHGAPAPALVPAGGHTPVGEAGALAAAARAFRLPAVTLAGLEAALLEPRSADRAAKWRAATGDLPAATGEALLEVTTRLATMPGPPVADGETVVPLPAEFQLPVARLTGAYTGVGALWGADTCAALGTDLLLVRGDAALDTVDRALHLVGAALPPASADEMRLLLTAGDIAGLPLPPPSDGSDTTLETTPDVLAALCAALVPDDPSDQPGWAALGALLYGPHGPHPWVRVYLRRRIGSAPVPDSHPALVPVLRSTWGLPLYCEQVSLLRILLKQDGGPPAAGLLQLQEWLDQAERWAAPYTAAALAGERVHLALRLKVEHRAAFLAAALESALHAGDATTLRALVLEASRAGITLRRPDIQAGGVGFGCEGPAAPPSTEPGGSPAGAGGATVRWGLAWSRATEQYAAALVEERRAAPGGRFESLDDVGAAAVARGVPVSYVAALVRAGACDSLGPRIGLLTALPEVFARAAASCHAATTAATGGQAAMFEPSVQTSDLSLAGAGEAAVLPDRPLEVPVPGLSAEGANAAYRAWEDSLLGHIFTPPLGAESVMADGRSAGVARLTLGGITPAHVGQTVSVTVVLGDVRVIPAGAGSQEAESMAVALAQDGGGALPLLFFPPAYTLHKAQLVPDSPVIVVARIQLAEAWEGQGASIVLIGEKLLPYAGARAEQELDVTPRKRRVPATDGPSPAAKPAPDPRQYSATGQRYFQASRPAAAVSDQPEPAVERESAAEQQVVITLHPLSSEGEDEDRMRRLKAILLRHPGPTGILLYFPDDPLVGMPTYMPLKRTVAVTSAFCAEVDTLLGAGCCALRPLG